MEPFEFKILVKDTKTRARTGIIKTKNGKIETPYLIPVATRGFIIALTKSDLKKISPQALLANTYHLHLKPGDEKIRKYGGLHKFMDFKKPIFTDSGGFQAFSLGIGREHGLRKIGFFPNNRKTIAEKNGKNYARITERGVHFISVYNEKEHFMDAKKSMEIQSNLNSNIIMAFDECTSPTQSKEEIKRAMIRSHKWELESLKHHNPKQALYGIIHGGWYKDLRLQSTKFIKSLPFDGVAIGGSLGETKKDMYEILDWIIPYLDNDLRPRHMLGIGWVEDLFECVERGLDTFDCVETTRIARHGNLYVSPESGGDKKNKFTISIKKALYEKDKRKISKGCNCETCKKYNRCQIRNILKTDKRKYYRYATIHNLHFMENLTKQIRESIKKGNFSNLKKKWLKD